MAAFNRLAWLRSEILNGRAVFVTMSYNPTNKTEKIKFTFDSQFLDAATSRVCLLSVLSELEVAMATGIVVDKGHQSHSSGNSYIEFWVKVVDAHVTDVRSIAADVTDVVADDLPPVPPPVLEAPIHNVTHNSDIVHKLEVLADKAEKIEQFAETTYAYAQCTHSSLAALAVPQDLIDAQNDTISTLRAWADSEFKIVINMNALKSSVAGIENFIASLSNPIQQQPPVVEVYSRQASSVDVGVQWPQIGMKKYCFKKSQTFVDTAMQVDPIVATVCSSVSAQTEMPCQSDAGTLVTARMLQDAIEDAATGYHLIEYNENIESDSANAPSSAVSSEDEEEFVPVDKSTMRSSRFWKARVYNHVRQSWGKVDSILKSAQNGEVLYRVRFERGGLANFPRDAIKSMVQSAEEREKERESDSRRRDRVKSKSSSSYT